MNDNFFVVMTPEQFHETRQVVGKGKRHYDATPVTHDGHEFPSTAEGNHYLELKLKQQAGLISDLECHPEFVIQKRCKRWGKIVSKRVYTADFKYWSHEENRWIVEDVKGTKITDKGKAVPHASGEFRLRFDLARVAYPEYEFRIVLR